MTKRLSAVGSPSPCNATTSGFPASWIALEPRTPLAAKKVSTASSTRMPIEIDSALGMECTGSFASSAASGTPSTPRKNHMPKGNADQMPSRPNGSQEPEPNASLSTGMSFRPSPLNSVNAPTAKISSAATAIAVTTRLKRSASPTPHRWMPMKIAKQPR